MLRMQNQKHKRHLKNFLINPRYQLRYIIWLTTTGLFLVLINGVIAYSYIKENYITLVDLSPMTDEAKLQMYEELRHLILALSLTSLAFLMIVSLLGIVLSHRTAGPLYHFKRVFDEVKKGKHQQRVKLRPGDEFQDVAKSFNDMMESLKINP